MGNGRRCENHHHKPVVVGDRFVMCGQESECGESCGLIARIPADESGVGVSNTESCRNDFVSVCLHPDTPRGSDRIRICLNHFLIENPDCAHVFPADQIPPFRYVFSEGSNGGKVQIERIARATSNTINGPYVSGHRW